MQRIFWGIVASYYTTTRATFRVARIAQDGERYFYLYDHPAREALADRLNLLADTAYLLGAEKKVYYAGLHLGAELSLTRTPSA